MEDVRRAGEDELEIKLLGPLEALRGGTVLSLGGQKPRALLAALALDAGRVVSVDQLIESLWPAEAPETAAHAVQVYVSQLRKALGPVIATRPPGYALELERDRIDVHRFLRLGDDGRAALNGGSPELAEGALRDALALWRGPALADFVYEPFAQTEIARLEELRTVVLEERIDADLALGRHMELVSELEGLVAAQPLRERPRAQLMLALYRSGRQADALAAYRGARETLVEELGIDPGPELKELEAAILRQDESLSLGEAAKPAMQFRRLAAILFCDVVESMGIAEDLDAEALAGIQRRFFDTVSAALTRHGGTVEKYAGDAVMAAFGVPIAHEDDALRAARAAFDIQTGVAALNAELRRERDVELEVRIGIAAGEVVAAATESRQRFVAGDAVGVAARLQHAAEPGEIVVGEIVARLIDHAARLEPLGMLEVKSRKAPIRLFRLVELEPIAPAFEQRQDARLVGRKRELAGLRRALKRSADDAAVRVSVVVGSPGVGKSRLVAEFTRRAKGVTTLCGRCLSYGDGITYWPLREALEQAAESEERDAVLAALTADTPPPAPELAWLFRRFCEASARERPLVLVFDDVHWAEPTFLELVEHLADKGEGPVAVVCLAREEFLEERQEFLAGRENADRILLDALSAEETDALLEGLGGATLESDQRARIAETAEGNPLFLEQLLALALEGGLNERPLPETIQALLAARLDRLGPGERAVLERGAVVGKEFTADDVVALLEPEAAPTADAHLQTLVGRGFVRPRGQGSFGFRHGLVQEAVYRAAPKRLRSELHERYADRLDSTAVSVPDLDEFVGYHLEQAYWLRNELGEADRRSEALAEEAGRRLGDAGVRAAKRGDVPAASSLLERATRVPLPPALHADLLVELGLMLRAAGALESSQRALGLAIERAAALGERRVELRARMEDAYVRNVRLSTPGEELLDAAMAAIPVFEASGDDRLLGRAWLLAGWVHGGHHGQYQVRLEAAERALGYYEQSTWPLSVPVGEIANALYFGPTAVLDAIERCESLLGAEALDRWGRANVEAFLGGLVAQTGDFARARALVSSAAATYEELGHHDYATMTCGLIRGEVELLAEDAVAAEEQFAWLCTELEKTQSYSHLATAAGQRAEALYQLQRVEEAREWTDVAERHSASDDLDALVLWMPVRAKCLARGGASNDAAEVAADAVRLAASTDALNRHARAHAAFAEVHSLAGRSGPARAQYEAALALYRTKGNTASADSMRALLGEGALVET